MPQSPTPSSISNDRSLIYFAPVGAGGLAKYAVFQITALAQLGLNVVVLGASHLEQDLKSRAPSVEFIPLNEPKPASSKIARGITWIRKLRSDSRHLRALVKDRQSNHVLITCFAEYFSPFWIGQLKALRRQGVRLGTIVHDPVRDFQVGPNWWHQLCISSAYSVIDVAYVHGDVVLDTGSPKQTVQVCRIPHGPYQVPITSRKDPRAAIRADLKIPQDAKLLLSFGHIRDGKNLDLLIAALKQVPELHLLVVGREQSSIQRPIHSYQDQAQSLNVHDRCHWVNEFVPDDAVSGYFLSADYVALVYSSDFRSASGVLNLASQFELPILASAGDGPLKDNILGYELGVFVQPDCSEALISGLNQLLIDRPAAKWHDYKKDHSWQANASTISQTLFDG